MLLTGLRMPRLAPTMTRLLKAAVSLSMIRIVTMAARLCYMVVVARLLGAELYGMLVYAQSWYLLFLPLTMLGLPPLINREVGRRGAAARDTVGHALSVMLFASVLGAVACGALALVAEEDPGLVLVMTVFATAVTVRSLYMRMENLMTAHERPSSLLGLTLVVRTLEPAAAFLLIRMGGGLLELAVLHAALWALQAAWAARVARRMKVLPPLHLPDRHTGRLLVTAFPLFLAAQASSQMQNGIVVLYRWIDGADIGQLALLVQGMLVLAVGPQSLRMALAPVLARRFAADPDHARAVSAFLLGATVLAGIALALVARPLAPVVLVPLLGADYAFAADHAWIAGIGMSCIGAATFLNQQFVVEGRFWGGCANTLGAVAVQAIGFVLLRPDTPVAGLAVGIAAFLAWAVIAAAQLGTVPALLRATASAAAGLGTGLAIADPWLGAAAGLAALAATGLLFGAVPLPRASTRACTRTPAPGADAPEAVAAPHHRAPL